MACTKDHYNYHYYYHHHNHHPRYLHGGDGSLLGGGDPLLHGTHVGGEGGLVADSRGDTTPQGRHLGTGLHTDKIRFDKILARLYKI